MVLAFDIIFILTVLALAIINLKTLILPNAIIFPGIVVFFLARVLLVVIDPNNFESSTLHVFSSPVASTIFDSLGGAMLGFGWLWTLNRYWSLTRGVDVLGFGDMKMMAMIGIYLGILNIVGMVFLCMIFGFIVGAVLLLLSRDNAAKHIPTGFIWGIPAILLALVNVTQIVGWFSKQL